MEKETNASHYKKSVVLLRGINDATLQFPPPKNMILYIYIYICRSFSKSTGKPRRLTVNVLLKLWSALLTRRGLPVPLNYRDVRAVVYQENDTTPDEKKKKGPIRVCTRTVTTVSSSTLTPGRECKTRWEFIWPPPWS